MAWITGKIQQDNNAPPEKIVVGDTIHPSATSKKLEYPLNKTSKEIENLKKEIATLRLTIKNLKFERDAFKVAAESWMTRYDDLRNKYEMEVLSE